MGTPSAVGRQTRSRAMSDLANRLGFVGVALAVLAAGAAISAALPDRAEPWLFASAYAAPAAVAFTIYWWIAQRS